MRTFLFQVPFQHLVRGLGISAGSSVYINSFRLNVALRSFFFLLKLILIYSGSTLHSSEESARIASLLSGNIFHCSLSSPAVRLFIVINTYVSALNTHSSLVISSCFMQSPKGIVSGTSPTIGHTPYYSLHLPYLVLRL